MTMSRWLIRRFVPTVLLVTAGGLAAGLLRSIGIFFPGITGMAAGGVLGWMTGRLARRDPEETSGFGLRAGFALGAAVLFETVGALTLSIFFANPGDGPLQWLHGVLSGYRGELFFGISRGSLQSVSGRLQGGSWVFFVLVDLLLFAMLFLVSHGAGFSPDDELTGDEDEPDAETMPEPEPPISDAAEVRTGPQGVVVLAVFVAVAAAAVMVPQKIWSIRHGPDAGPQAHAMAVELAGPWVFGPQASFLGDGAADRSFTLSYGPGGKLAGQSAGSGGFLLTLEPRRDGSYTGRLVVPGAVAFTLRMRPSDTRGELRFVLTRDASSGPMRRQLDAHRPTGQPR